MPTTHQDKPSGKPRKRNRKADQPDQKPEQQQSPMLDRREEDQIDRSSRRLAADDRGIRADD